MVPAMGHGVSQKLLSEGRSDRTLLYELAAGQALQERHPGCRVVVTVLSGALDCARETLRHGDIRSHDGDTPLELRGGAVGCRVLVSLIR